jgi:hypothetical protein
VHAEELVFREQLRDVALLVLDIAEMQRLRDAAVDAGRRRLVIDAGLEALGEACIDPVRAKRALGRNAQALFSSCGGFTGHRSP